MSIHHEHETSQPKPTGGVPWAVLRPATRTRECENTRIERTAIADRQLPIASWRRRALGLAMVAAAAWAISPGCDSAGGGEAAPPAAEALPKEPPATAAAEASPKEPPATAAAPKTDAPTTTKAWKPPRFEARQDDRDRMVETIRRYGLTDKKVLAAMGHVPRHEFVLDKYLREAYADTPLPIGYGQTISQPYMVAEMTRRLQLTSDSKVLEIGTGSGYQAAVLTEFTPHVWTIEIVKPLAETAGKRLKRLGYDTVEVRRADGYDGWAEHAPYDAIIVTAAAGQVPPPLLKQLANGGKMIIPVGGVLTTQSLMLVEKDADGKVTSRSLMAVRFVPFTRRDASEDEDR